jgi:RNA polymerase sigma-70 factor (ECF subfamily)
MDEGCARTFQAREGEFILVNRCLQGDAAAWEAVVHSYGPRIQRMACRYGVLRNEAEDLAQEVFVRVYRHLETFRADTGSLQNWVVRVGRNLLIDHFRASRRIQDRGGSKELEEMKLKDEQVPSPDRVLERSEAAEIVEDVLQVLSPELKQAIVLRYLEGMTYQEMADHLGVPEGTVKSRINRGREKLARRLSGRGTRSATRRSKSLKLQPRTLLVA